MNSGKKRHQIKGFLWGHVDDVLRKTIQMEFPFVDIYFRKGRYHLYSVYKGTIPTEDILVKEFVLSAKPGTWLIQHLKFHERKINKFKAGYLIDAIESKEEEEKEKQIRDVVNNTVEAFVFMRGNRTSIPLGG